MAIQAQHQHEQSVVEYWVISGWRYIIPWAFIMGALGFCVAGSLTVALGWEFAASGQWLAVDWGIAGGAITGAIIAYVEHRNRP